MSRKGLPKWQFWYNILHLAAANIYVYNGETLNEYIHIYMETKTIINELNRNGTHGLEAVNRGDSSRVANDLKRRIGKFNVI